jgi:D-amino-acid dehydrogenase
MYVYRGTDDFEQDRKGWDLRTKFGIEWSLVEGAELHKIAPTLSPDYTIGAKIKVAVSLRDPGAFCAGLAKHFSSLGGELIKSTALGFSTDGRQLISVRTNEGDIDCDRAIICAGAASAHLARQAGNKIPLVSERGYHIEVLDCPLRLKTSLMPVDGKMAVATTRTGLRLAGQVELAAPLVAPDWNRARIQLNHAAKMFPHMAEAIRQGPHDMWMGNRPSTPDCLPVIGKACGSNEIFYAFGHGHTGMAMSPATAALIADVVAGWTPSVDPRPYSPQRFRLVA